MGEIVPSEVLNPYEHFYFVSEKMADAIYHEQQPLEIQKKRKECLVCPFISLSRITNIIRTVKLNGCSKTLAPKSTPISLKASSNAKKDSVLPSLALNLSCLQAALKLSKV